MSSVKRLINNTIRIHQIVIKLGVSYLYWMFTGSRVDVFGVLVHDPGRNHCSKIALLG